MNYIKELYSGNLNLSLQKFTKNSRYDKLITQEAEVLHELSKKLGDNKELLEKMFNIQDEINYITSIDSYADGFRDGSKLMIDILLGRNENLNRE